MKKVLIWIILGMLMIAAVPAPAEEAPGASDDTTAASALAAGETQEAVITADEENGLWEYRSETLTIRVTRYRETVKIKKKNKPREYCVAEIWASPESPLIPSMTDPYNNHAAGYRQVSPELIEQKTAPVLAFSDDMYGLRINKVKVDGVWKTKYDYHGVVIRNGEVIATKTRNSAKRRAWPNLDTMALFADGSMKTYVCDEHTAEEYLEMGATQVFAFGPILIRDGVINADVLDPKYYPNNEPRIALGMVEPYHYVAIAVRGRPTEKYAGVHLDWMAQKMQEMGCVEALNLDGGETVIMFFDGKIILQGGSKLRSQGSLITFGPRKEYVPDGSK